MQNKKKCWVKTFMIVNGHPNLLIIVRHLLFILWTKFHCCFPWGYEFIFRPKTGNDSNIIIEAVKAKPSHKFTNLVIFPSLLFCKWIHFFASTRVPVQDSQGGKKKSNYYWNYSQKNSQFSESNNLQRAIFFFFKLTYSAAKPQKIFSPD